MYIIISLILYRAFCRASDVLRTGPQAHQQEGDDDLMVMVKILKSWPCHDGTSWEGKDNKYSECGSVFLEATLSSGHSAPNYLLFSYPAHGDYERYLGLRRSCDDTTKAPKAYEGYVAKCVEGEDVFPGKDSPFVFCLLLLFS